MANTSRVSIRATRILIQDERPHGWGRGRPLTFLSPSMITMQNLVLYVTLF